MKTTAIQMATTASWSGVVRGPRCAASLSVFLFLFATHLFVPTDAQGWFAFSYTGTIQNDISLFKFYQDPQKVVDSGCGASDQNCFGSQSFIQPSWGIQRWQLKFTGKGTEGTVTGLEFGYRFFLQIVAPGATFKYPTNPKLPQQCECFLRVYMPNPAWLKNQWYTDGCKCLTGFTTGIDGHGTEFNLIDGSLYLNAGGPSNNDITDGLQNITTTAAPAVHVLRTE